MRSGGVVSAISARLAPVGASPLAGAAADGNTVHLLEKRVPENQFLQNEFQNPAARDAVYSLDARFAARYQT